ncbi:hypothetical protein ACFV08_00200 [Streptomyces fradiae]|uniref:hypothetical protein n=1 Tax=Streptomyces fradiae TaxID=1906 RepID=UPI0036884C3C
MPRVSDGAAPGTSAETLASISVPDRQETVFGAMDFFDGLPLPDTVTRGYDTLDLLRGIEVFLDCVPGASMVGCAADCGRSASTPTPSVSRPRAAARRRGCSRRTRRRRTA